MNILFLTDFPIVPSAGGIQRVTDILARELIIKGHVVNYLVLGSPLIDESSNSEVKQFYVDIEHSKKWKKEIENIVLALQVDYIINQSPNSITCKVLKELNQNYKIVSVFHTQPFFNDNITRKQIFVSKTYNLKQKCFKLLTLVFPKLRSYLFCRYEKINMLLAANLSHKTCFISDRFYTRVLKHIPEFPKEKLCAINNPNTFEACDCTSTKENLIVWIGRIENTTKNTIGFIQIWEQLYKNNPRWKAIVAGSGDDLCSVKKYANIHSLKNIEFIGKCDDVQSLYKRAKFVVVTSYSESWCMVLTEGLAQGCVVAAYDTYETVHDIIRDGNGIVTEPNPKMMAKKLHYLMNNEQEYQKLARQTLNSIKNYNVELIANQWIKLLSTIK